MAKKSHFNTGKTAVQAEKKTPAVRASQSASWRDEEELVDYKPESPPSLSPAVEDFSEPEDRLRTPVPGHADDSASDEDFRENPAEDAAMAGRKRRRPLTAAEIFSSPLTKTICSKTNRQPLLGRAVSPLSLLSGTRECKPTEDHLGGK
jgi:hypothetical protein